MLVQQFWFPCEAADLMSLSGGAGVIAPALHQFAVAKDAPRDAHALWQCGLRPFFTAATVAAIVAVLPWLSLLVLGTPVLPGSDLFPITQWHALLLLGGMGLAAVAGFLLTAIPEFTSSSGFESGQVRVAATIWLVAFVCDAVGQRWSMAVAGVLWSVFVLWLLVLVLPRAWSQVDRPHLGFIWGVFALGVAIAGWHVDVLLVRTPTRWLDVLLAVNNLKSVSSRLLRKWHGTALKAHFRGPVLWSRSYFISSVGGANLETVRRYIEAQERPE